MIFLRDIELRAPSGAPSGASPGAILSGTDPKTLARPRVLTAGSFDGLHRAHQRLIERVVAEAGTAGTAAVLTFSNHPLSVLAPPYTPKLLLNPERKAALLRRLGIGLLAMPVFSPSLAAMEPERFVRDLLVGWLGVDRMAVGFDFRFGREGAGDAEDLERLGARFGFDVEIVPALYHEDAPIGSTRIRELIEEGRVRLAGAMLGRPHELEGPVVHGHGRGAQLGFPTANLEFDPAYAIPSCGVYAVFVVVGERRYKGMMNIGTSPTFAGTAYRPEVFLLDFDGSDLYGRSLRVLFVERLREERKFATVEALRKRLSVDETMARAVLEAYAGGASLDRSS